MNEPVLSDKFLGREIYRVIGLRSFHQPIVARIENDKGRVSIVTKKLNRHITYPFNDYYAQIFRWLIENSEFDNEKLY